MSPRRLNLTVGRGGSRKFGNCLNFSRYFFDGAPKLLLIDNFDRKTQSNLDFSKSSSFDSFLLKYIHVFCEKVGLVQNILLADEDILETWVPGSLSLS